MKKDILLLGAGAMGTVAAQTIAEADEVGRLIVADRDRARLEEAARKCPANVAIETIDVTDRGRLIALIRRADVVMNCVGPFFRFGVPILEAAIAAGVDCAWPKVKETHCGMVMPSA